MRANLPSQQKPDQPRRAGIVGLAFDAEDGTKRITRGMNYVLAGGSAETHGLMQETAVKINEHLDRGGKRLEDVSVEELRDVCRKIHDT